MSSEPHCGRPRTKAGAEGFGERTARRGVQQTDRLPQLTGAEEPWHRRAVQRTEDAPSRVAFRSEAEGFGERTARRGVQQTDRLPQLTGAEEPWHRRAVQRTEDAPSRVAF